jgi:hypothetical protein
VDAGTMSAIALLNQPKGSVLTALETPAFGVQTTR